MVQYPIKISEENSKNSRFYGYLKLVLILSHFRVRTLYVISKSELVNSVAGLRLLPVAFSAKILISLFIDISR